MTTRAQIEKKHQWNGQKIEADGPTTLVDCNIMWTTLSNAEHMRKALSPMEGSSVMAAALYIDVMYALAGNWSHATFLFL
jgi:hypothetical protein